MINPIRDYRRVEFATDQMTQLVEGALMDFVDQHPASQTGSDRVVLWRDAARSRTLYLSPGAFAAVGRLFTSVPDVQILPGTDLPMGRVLVLGDAWRDDRD